MSRQMLIRSELSVPGGNPRMVEKALASDADAFFIDLEDSVAPDRKVLVRAESVRLFAALDWGSRQRVIRINGIDSPWCLHDLVATVHSPGAAIDRIVVPKVRNAGDVAFLVRLIRQVLSGSNRNPEEITFEIQIEDAHGLANLDAILAESDQIAVVTFGQGDFAASTGMPANEIGVPDEWDTAVNGDRWLFPRQQIVFAAARAGIPALNGPYAAYSDGDGFRSYCRMSRALGFAGVWCIHPNQIPIANEVFAPTPGEIERANATLAAVESGWAKGSGAVSRDNIMTDEANVRMAQSILDRAAAVELKAKTGTQ